MALGYLQRFAGKQRFHCPLGLRFVRWLPMILPIFPGHKDEGHLRYRSNAVDVEALEPNARIRRPIAGGCVRGGVSGRL